MIATTQDQIVLASARANLALVIDKVDSLDTNYQQLINALRGAKELIDEASLTK